MEKNLVNSTIYKLLPPFLRNELSEKDIRKVNDWRHASENNESEFQAIKKTWELTGVLKRMESFDTPSALQRFRNNIDKNKRFSISWLQRVAAVLLLPLLIYSGVLTYSTYFSSIGKHKLVWQEYKAIPGAISTFTLPDGTTVYLNMGSALKFPSEFSKNEREVVLEGEAFFDVVRNENCPFIVNTGKINVEVLGTKFNVCNYDEDRKMQVVLESGSVAFFQGDYKNKKELGRLVPGEKMEYSVDSKTIAIDQVKVENFTKWKEGILVFEDTPMQDVINRLSRWYNVDIEIVDKELKSHYFTATFANESLSQVLQLLKYSTPIDYEITKKRQLNKNIYSKEEIKIFMK